MKTTLLITISLLSMACSKQMCVVEIACTKGNQNQIPAYTEPTNDSVFGKWHVNEDFTEREGDRTSWIDLADYKLMNELGEREVEILTADHRNLSKWVSLKKSLNRASYGLSHGDVVSCQANKAVIRYESRTKGELKHYILSASYDSSKGEEPSRYDCTETQGYEFHLYYQPSDRKLYICSGDHLEMERSLEGYDITNFLNYCTSLTRSEYL